MQYSVALVIAIVVVFKQSAHMYQFLRRPSPAKLFVGPDVSEAAKGDPGLQTTRYRKLLRSKGP